MSFDDPEEIREAVEAAKRDPMYHKRQVPIIELPAKQGGKLARIEAASSEEMALETLLDKLEGWLLLQPEWPRIMGSANRAARKRLAAEMAKYITTIPTREGVPFGREQRRRMTRAMKQDERQWMKGVKE
jgi:hypothetical protein